MSDRMKNSVQFIGRIGTDMEVKKTKKDVPFLTMRIATSELYNGEQHTEWHNVIAFGNTALYIERQFEKGDLVLVAGKLRHRSYQDKDEITRYYSEVHIDEAMLLNKARSNAEKEEVMAA